MLRLRSFFVCAAFSAAGAAGAACSGAVTIGENGTTNDEVGTDAAVSDGGSTRPDAAGQDAAVLDATTSHDAAAACAACGANDICVAHRVIGGALIQPDDAGNCPPGRHLMTLSGGDKYCENDWQYACEPRPPACTTTVDCSCAGANYCESTGLGGGCGSGADEGADLACQMAVP